MLNRLFKYNRVFSILFLLSLFVSFIIMYYGLDLNRQLVQVSAVREESIYQYGYVVTGIFREDLIHPNDIKDGSMSGGNIIFRCDGPIGEGVINVDAIDILWTQNEELLESVKYEEYYLTGTDISAPKCIIGDAWKKDTYVIDGIRYIKVFKIECCVIGEYESNTFTGRDERCLVLKDSLSPDELDKLVFNTGSICVIYKSNVSDETESFTEWTHTFLQEDPFHEYNMENAIYVSVGEAPFAKFISLYQKVYICMLTLCFINCAFLAYFWGGIHVYEYMLKRTLGYGKLRLFIDILSQFALFEAISLGAAFVLTGGYELIFGNIITWYDNIRLGFMQAVLIFVIFGAALSAFPMRLVMKLKPADILKNTD